MIDANERSREEGYQQSSRDIFLPGLAVTSADQGSLPQT